MKIITQLWNTHPGILVMPDDYLTGPDMAIIVYDAGVSENKANGTLDYVDVVYANGSPLQLAKDGKLNNVVDPETGKSYRFAVFCLQGAGWPVNPAELSTFVQQLLGQYKIDKTRVFKSGLSAGACNTWLSIGMDKTNMYAAAVPLSSCGIDTNAVNGWKDTKAKIFAIHGSQDGTCDINYSKTYVAAANLAHPGSAYLFSTNDGHGGWPVDYDPATKYTLPGYSKPINVYEFMLMAVSKPDFTFTAAGTTGTTTGGTTTQPVSTTKAIPVVTIVKGTATLSANTSVLNGKDATSQAAFDWKIIPGVAFATGDYGGADLADRTATGFKPNTAYAITLHVTDRYGGQNSATLNIITDANGSYGGTVTGTTTTATKKLVATVKVFGAPAVAAVPDKTVNTYQMPDGTFASEVV